MRSVLKLAAMALTILVVNLSTPAFAQYIGETAVVRSSDGTLNIRSDTSTGSAIMGVLENDESVTVLEVAGNWVRVAEAAGAGWIYVPLLSVPSIEVMAQLIADNPDANIYQIQRSFERFDGANLGFTDTGVADFSALVGLAGLKDFQIYEVFLRDISSLAGLTSLEVLYLDELSGVSDLSPLAHLTALKELVIIFSDASDISVLSHLTDLEKLVLWQVDVSDLSVLSGLTKLKELDVGGNALTDISPLADLTGLEVLKLNEMSGLRDLSPLAGLTGLQSLHLGGTFGVDVAVLSHLTGLEIMGVLE